MYIKEKNMKNKIFILGAGAMAREVFQIYKQSNKEEDVAGFLVNRRMKQNKKLPLEIFDHVSNSKGIKVINGIGSPLRKKWISLLLAEGFVFDKIIHPSAIVSQESRLGIDAVVSANSIISCNVSIGNHVILNLNTNISHDSIIGDFTTISPGVNIGGNVKVESGSFIGIGSTVIQGVSIGSNVFIGAGSVVVEDIPNNVLAYGNPARVVRNIDEADWEELI